MKHLLLTVVAVAVPSVAHADPATQLAKDLDGHFSYWRSYRDDPGSRANALGHDPTPADCEAAIAKARKAGLANDAKIYAYEFKSFEEADYDDQKRAYMTFEGLDQMCKVWRDAVKIAPVAAFMKQIVSAMKSYELVEPGSLGKSMIDVFMKEAKDCFAKTDAAITAGAPGDRKVKIGDETMTLVEGRAKVCQAYLDWATSLGGKVTKAHAADREKRAAPYVALGVGGARLELFLEYDDVYWRGGASCQRITDLKKLAKAKALFQWLENSDGTHTIRKYTFRGNNVSGPISKTYTTAGAAQRGCK